MKKIIIHFFAFVVLFSHEIDQKLIVYGEENATLVQDKFIKLQHYFKENIQAKNLQKRYGLILKKEHIDKYSIVVIRPIYSYYVKNKLLSIVQPLFPESFTIEENRESKKISSKIEKKEHSIEEEITQEILSFEEHFGIRPEWLAILILSIIGLSMSIWNRKKLLALEMEQKAFREDQKAMEVEISQFGGEDV